MNRAILLAQARSLRERIKNGEDLLGSLAAAEAALTGEPKSKILARLEASK